MPPPPAPDSIDTFNLFPTLPAELRIKIWHHAMQRQRIIHMRLRIRWLMDGLLARQAQGQGMREGERYGIVVNGFQTLSKAFRINRESRQEALGFYRVHLPCWLIKGRTRDDTMKPGILYFNPEHDFLSISNDMCPVPEFVHDLKTVYDPRGVGLLNLAVDGNGLTGAGGLCSIDLSTLSCSHRTSFIETLMQLQEVFFVQIQYTGRHVYGIRSGATTTENQRNLSFPIAAMALNFDRLRRDPRPIDHDLSQVFVNLDPRGMIYSWKRLFYDLLGHHTIPQHTKQRVLLALASSGFDVYNKQDAREWLQKEEDNWVKETSADDQLRHALAQSLEAVVETAFGFWLFPIDAFGAVPENPRDAFRTERPRTMDLKEHWPELALLNLP